MPPRLAPGGLGQGEEEIEDRLGKHRNAEEESGPKEGKRRPPLPHEPLDRGHDPLRPTGLHQALPEDRSHRDEDPDVVGRLPEALGDPAADREGRCFTEPVGRGQRRHD